jgi:hypothetical protein
MFDLAGIGRGDRVLEIGTGTGYSTALLRQVLGAEKVHSVEYDAVVATCAVRYAPSAWLRQVRVGGGSTVCLSGWTLASGLVRLTVHDDGTASGRFTGDRVGYMLARPHERPPRPAAFQQRPGPVRPTRPDPGLVDDWTGAFVAQLAAPSAELMKSGDGVTLVDVATGSQAWTRPQGQGQGWVVHQHGPLRLRDAVEDGLATWRAAGAPGQDGSGLTVRDDDTQRVWIGEPGGVGWEPPV